MSEPEVVQSLENFKKLFEQLKVKLNAYKEANERLSNEKDQLRMDLEAKDTKIKELENRVTELTNDRNGLAEENSRLRTQLGDAGSNNETLSKSQEALDNEIKRLMAEAEDLLGEGIVGKEM